MSTFAGWRCNRCGNESRKNAGSCEDWHPRDWFTLDREGAVRHFCSADCVHEWLWADAAEARDTVEQIKKLRAGSGRRGPYPPWAFRCVAPPSQIQFGRYPGAKIADGKVAA